MGNLNCGRLARIGRSLALAALIGAAASAAPAAYPEKPVRIVIPFTPGGGTDAIARTLAAGMSEDLGQPVIVESKPGAGTVIGNDAVAKSPPDGYTILLTTSAFSIVPSFTARMPYDGAAAFAPIAILGRGPNMVVVKADSPFKTLAELLAHAKANPGRLTYGSPGNGTSVHMSAELMKSRAGAAILHVPYRGAGPQITALLGGQLDFAVASVPASVPFIKSGQLRVLAVTSAQRSPAWPDVPTVAESGLPDYASDVWYGIFAPKGTPPAVVERLNRAVKKAASAESFVQRIENEGVAISVSTPEALGELASTEEQRWKAFVKEHGLKAD